MKKLGCVVDAFLGWPWVPKYQKVCTIWTPLATSFSQKSRKGRPKRHPKINIEKVQKINAKRCQNEAIMASQIHDFSFISTECLIM